jgi:serine phosphatase RsbU (regulator of sigma subunit)
MGATCLYAVYDPVTRRCAMASAGHPPPVVVTPGGTVAALGGRRGDLLLGVDPTARRGESTAVLAPGSTLLLFTDGLVERRDSDLVAGLDRLERALADLADQPLERLCDELLDRLVGPHPSDDVALVALRLSR